MLRFLLSAAVLAAIPATAGAQEVFVGVMAHGVDTPLTFDTGERGADIQLGVRGRPIVNAGVASLRPYAFVSKNTKGNTSFAAAGVALTVGLPGFFVRPGIGIAVDSCCLSSVLGLACDGLAESGMVVAAVGD